jgi:hypothetical protein
VLANDGTTTGTPVVKWNPGYGAATMNDDGTFTYTKGSWATAPGGQDEFFYELDGQIVKVSITIPEATTGGEEPVDPVNPEPTDPEISLDGPAQVTEGGAAIYTFIRSGSPTSALDVVVNVSGTAVPGQDYTAVSAMVSFAAGSTTATLTIQTTDDTPVEQAETLSVVVAQGTGYTVNGTAGSVTTQLLDNDVATPLPATNQTITAVTTEGMNFTGGAGNDTLVFPTIAAGQTQMLGGTSPVTNVISLGALIVGTIYAGKTISNIENLTFESIQGPAPRTLTINGDANDNILTVSRTTRKTDINGGDGSDTINYTGTGLDAQASVISGGTGNDTVKVSSAAIIDDRVSSGTSGDDTYDIGTGARQEIRFGTNNGNDTVKNYSLGEGTIHPDVLDFSAAGIDASTVTVSETGGNTVFRINGSSTVTVEGVTGLEFGKHWKALGTYAPPVVEPPPDEPTGEAGIDVSSLSLNVAEGGASDTMDVKLTRKPTHDVTVTLGSDGGLLFSVGGGAPSATPTLTFTPSNWNRPQTVTVTAIDDTDYQAVGGGTTIYFEPITSQDPLYADYFPPSGWATFTENDPEPSVAPPTAQATGADVWEDNPVVELQGNGYSAGDFGITAYEIVSQPVEGGTVTMTDDRTFRFEGDMEFLSSLNRGDVKPITFEYRVSDGEVWSAPAKMTFNVYGFTNGADETYQAFTHSTLGQTDFLALNGGDGNDTVVFNSITVTSGEDVSVALDKAFHWTEYQGKSIINTENITIKTTNGDTNRTMTVAGNDQANVLTIESTSHKLFVNGLGGDDTFHFNGTGIGVNSIITGGTGNDTVNANSGVVINDRAMDDKSGNDTYNFGTGVQHVQFYDQFGTDTVTNFQVGVDKLHFLDGVTAADVAMSRNGADTVFAVVQNDGTTDTVTVKNATLTSSDWMFT